MLLFLFETKMQKYPKPNQAILYLLQTYMSYYIGLALGSTTISILFNYMLVHISLIHLHNLSTKRGPVHINTTK